MSDLYELRKQAFQSAQQNSACSLSSIAIGYWPTLKPSGKGAVLDTCPYCEHKKKFGVWNNGSYWGCQRTSCPANIGNIKDAKKANAVGLVMYQEGLNFNEAAEKMCSLAGIPWPELKDLSSSQKKRTQKKATKAIKKEAKKAAAKAKPSSAIKMPEEGKRNPWEEIYTRLTLRDEDRMMLKTKRGFTDKTIDFNGYRSSTRQNRPLLNEIIDLFPEEELLELGVVMRDKETANLKINAQFCGLGLKKRSKDKDADDFGWVEPILIPYIASNGRITYIRPHKGGISPKAYMEEKKVAGAFYYSKAISHPYGEHIIADIQETGGVKWKNSCVLTEGEFKIAALGQVGLPALGIPGIHITRNPVFLKELVKVLKLLDIKNVRTIFDNDDKSHISDPWDRHDVDVYARYAAHVLRTKGFFTYVGSLPDEWKKLPNGKMGKTADWDGRLSYLVALNGNREGTAIAKKEFKKVYFSCFHYDGQIALWDNLEEKHRIINCKLKKLTYEREVPIGGTEEKRKIQILRKCPDSYKDLLNVRYIMASLNKCIGCYYQPNFLTKEERGAVVKQKKEIIKAGDCCESIEEEAGIEAALLAVNILLAGVPEPISNFTISCDYTIKTRTGTHERLFILTNTNNVKSGCCQPEAKDLSSPTKFREFLLSRGGYNWLGGQKVLDLLIKDLDVESEWRQINELDTIGLDIDSGLYILGDCAFGKKPFDVIFPDHENIIWNQGAGYRIDPDDLGEFAHKIPPMFFQSDDDETPQQVFQKIMDDPEKEKQEVTAILEELIWNMMGTTGGLEGVLLVCAALAYAVAPETIKKHNSQHGIWLHGQAGSGKTDTARQLMCIWGYILSYDIPTMGEGTTNVGMDRLMSQYCSWMMHLDEFREDEANKAKVASLRNAYNRQSKKKGRMDQTKKTNSYTPLTMPIVTGESTTTDAATKSRFIGIILSAEKRHGTPSEQADRYKNMMLNAEKYHRIGRWIMLNRKTFAKAVMAELAQFLSDEEVSKAIPTARLRTTYGPAYAVYRSLDSIFNITHTEEIRQKFRKFTLGYVAKAAEEVAQVNFTTKFWDDVASLYTRDHRVRKYMRVAFCCWQEGSKTPTPLIDTHDGVQPPSSEACILISGKTVHDFYSADKRGRGETPELSYQNLMTQLQQTNAWVKSDSGSHRVTLRKGGGGRRVWILRIKLMDEATQEVFAPFIAEMLEDLSPDEQQNSAIENW